MRDRRVRCAFILLILAFPAVIDTAGGATEQHPQSGAAGTARASFDPLASWQVHATQAVLIAGLVIAGRERRRLEDRLTLAYASVTPRVRAQARMRSRR